MNNKCDVKGCNRKNFQANKQCVLHCEKHTYSVDRNNIKILSQFYNELVDYIVEEISDRNYRNDDMSSRGDILEYFRSGNGDQSVIEFCRKQKITFSSIFFPAYDERDPFDYLPVINRIGKAYFNYCKFTTTLLHTPSVEVFYQDCEFRQNWFIHNSLLLENINHVVYQECHFWGDTSVVIWGDSDTVKVLDVSLFDDCTFHKMLSFENLTLEKKIFNNSGYLEIKIDSLKINNCIIQNDFILNQLNANSVLIIDTEFKSKFEMKDSHITMMFEARNTNFVGMLDVQDSNFGGFECFKCVFSNVASFEYCNFSVGRDSIDCMAIFKYTTFLSFTSFRNSIFHLGLDLENANLKEAPNFLNIKLLSDNTNRETLRIIKNSFDKIGNHIDANEFFVKEMKKYKQELSRQRGNWQERIILWFNEKASDFGQSYLRPIIGVFLIAIFYSGLIYAQENNYLDFVYKIFPSLLNTVISGIVQFFNEIAKNIIPFKSFAKEGMEFLSLIFYIIFASLTWQTIVAFKRHTKR